MSHKIFKQIHVNCDENFYGEFHLTKKNKKYTNERICIIISSAKL